MHHKKYLSLIMVASVIRVKSIILNTTGRMQIRNKKMNKMENLINDDLDLSSSANEFI